MVGMPVLASMGLRQTLSPTKPTQPLHRSLNADTIYDDGHNAKRVIDHYQDHINETGGLDESWTPPPLPVEISARGRRYEGMGDEDGEYGDGYNDGESGLFYEDDGQSLSALSSEAGGRLSRVDPDIVTDALQLIYEQKKRTVENIKNKRATMGADSMSGSRVMISMR
jgi:hypothetical protein